MWKHFVCLQHSTNLEGRKGGAKQNKTSFSQRQAIPVRTTNILVFYPQLVDAFSRSQISLVSVSSLFSPFTLFCSVGTCFVMEL